MKIRDIAKNLVIALLSEEPDNLLKKVESILWEEFRYMLNLSFYMRRFQRQYQEYKDKMSKETSERYTAEFDALLSDLQKEKEEPELNL